MDLVHVRHYLDGYPLCWPMDKEGEFNVSEYDQQITCPECKKILEEADE